MRLSENQESLLFEVKNAVDVVEAVHKKHRVALMAELPPVQDSMLVAVRKAAAAGVPKRQLQKAVGVSGTKPFYDLLRAAGVPIEKPPEVLSTVLGSVAPGVKRKPNVLDGMEVTE